MSVPLPPLSITGGASAPAVAEGGNQGGATLTQSGFKIGIFGVVGLIVLSGALVWINRK